MNSFWEKFQPGFTCLAPMEGVTDIVFRQVVAKAARPDIFFTEFTNVNSYFSEKGRHDALTRFRFLPQEQPIVAQIWGTQPAHFSFTAQALANLGFEAVDINMGCPDRHVVATGGGSALIRDPARALEIISAVKSSGLATSVKTRLGYSRVEEWRDWLSLLLSQNLSALTVHLRTKREMSKVPAHFELVPDIIALRSELAPQTKLIINGDIPNPAFGQQFIEQGADGIMIGRGVFANPFCFEHLPRPHDKSELITLLQYHLDLFDQYQLMTFDPLKRFFKIYINNFPGASEIRNTLMQTKSTTEVRDIIKQL